MVINSRTILIIALIIIIFISVVYLISLAPNEKTLIKGCKDSDGGADYFTKGYITYPSTVYDNDGSKKENVKQEWWDECLIKIDIEGPRPDEYSCIRDPNGEITACYKTNVSQCLGNNCYIKEQVCTDHVPEYHLCPNGCEDGACIK